MWRQGTRRQIAADAGTRRQPGMWRQVWRLNAASARNAASGVTVATGNAVSQRGVSRKYRATECGVSWEYGVSRECVRECGGGVRRQPGMRKMRCPCKECGVTFFLERGIRSRALAPFCGRPGFVSFFGNLCPDQVVWKDFVRIAWLIEDERLGLRRQVFASINGSGASVAMADQANHFSNSLATRRPNPSACVCEPPWPRACWLTLTATLTAPL